MFQKNYETVFILTPVLSEVQMKDTVDKYVGLLKELGAEVVNVENWLILSKRKLPDFMYWLSTKLIHLQFRSMR